MINRSNEFAFDTHFQVINKLQKKICPLTNPMTYPFFHFKRIF